MVLKYKKHLSRRTFLRGAGTVCIGLPFVEAMCTKSVFANDNVPPLRAFHVFFGLGCPREIQAQGFTDALEPLGPFSDKLLLVRGITQQTFDASYQNHYDGSSLAFTGTRPRSNSRSGGPSFDQVILRDHYQNGTTLPAQTLRTVAMGSYFRRADSNARYAHCRREDGNPATMPHETPRALFQALFGSLPGEDNPQTPEQIRQNHIQRSILDSVKSQIDHYRSERSNLGAASRSEVSTFFDQVRQYELKTFGSGPGEEQASCTAPNQPGSGSALPHGGAADPGGSGVDIRVQDWVPEWELMVDLYVAAIRCDRVRLGGITFQSGGERIRLSGQYRYKGRDIYNFRDRQVRGQGGAGGCSHEFFHAYNPNNTNRDMKHHLHFMMAQIGYFFEKLSVAMDGNGKSIMENALCIVSTELDYGGPHSLTQIMHAITPANGKFRTGAVNVQSNGLNLYNTCLEALGTNTIPQGGYNYQRISQILA